MFSTKSQQSQYEDFAQKGVVRSVVARGDHANPALQRLQARILKSADASEVITSYDRMHHRHNRS
ncbi:YhhA family cyclophane-containing RiPP [Achromobacter xylosoxidans]|uniref:YhhA family cyclophane-containing RiPP n=1 Tax=Achromobacter TaxID=222 RepID=UPI001EEBC9F5|nr:YhhA family cyclophane-containing RiPP [Achromobacter xylosoxidans]